jgi:general secretion pathway protein A
MPLDEAESDAYLRHRIAVAGGKRFPFTRLAVRSLHRAAGGVPRLLNVIAERALLAGYVADEVPVGEALVAHAADEVLQRPRRSLRRTAIAGVLAVLVAVGALAWRNAPWSATAQAPAPPPVAAPAPVAETLREALAGIPEGAELGAWTHLLALWSVDADQVAVRDAARCPASIQPGLSCLRGGGNLAKLEAIDRPVLLALREGERPLLALLIAVDAGQVALDLGTRSVTVPRAELEAQWLGEYLAVWRMPLVLEESVKLGQAGPAVAWIARQLSAFDKLPVPADPAPLYDAALESRVRRVQAQFGLLPDGIVGPETLLVLSSRDGTGPHLARTTP